MAQQQPQPRQTLRARTPGRRRTAINLNAERRTKKRRESERRNGIGLLTAPEPEDGSVLGPDEIADSAFERSTVNPSGALCAAAALSVGRVLSARDSHPFDRSIISSKHLIPQSERSPARHLSRVRSARRFFFRRRVLCGVARGSRA